MDDLIRFLNARLDKDAERAYSGWGRDPEGRWESMDEGNSVMTPRAVLADIAAKRQIIEEHWADERGRCSSCAEEQAGYEDNFLSPAPWPCRTLRLLALPFASHPDYREEWRV